MCECERCQQADKEIEKVDAARASAASAGYTPCSKCGKNTILASGIADEFIPDSEPFKPEIEEKTEFEEVILDTPLYVHIKWCPECGHIEEKWLA